MRILLKLSGELFKGEKSLDGQKAEKVAQKIAQRDEQIALVIGAGNIYRGINDSSIDRVASDQMGMLATLINSIFFCEILQKAGVSTTLFSSFAIDGMVAPFNKADALRAMDKGDVVIIAGGTGNPFFTTDSAAALRAIQLECDYLLKATKVDALYDQDPLTSSQAKLISKTTFDQVLKNRYQVMDLTAMTLCSEHNLPLIIFNLNNGIDQALQNKTGTIIRREV